MLEPISIGSTAHFDFLKAKLDWELRNLQTDGLQVTIDESSVGEINFIGCNIDDYGSWNYSEEDISKIFRHHLANVISDVIISEWEEDLLDEIIRENYYYFNEDERKIIFEHAFQSLNHSLDTPGDGLVYSINRKSKILQKLLDYLAANNQLVVDGFIKFRLKEYLNELEESVERAVDDFIMDREYKEFIRLLKYFVDIQEPRIELVHVTLAPSGAFRLRDKDRQVIESDYLDGILLDQADTEINYEDLLVSALITLAPKEVVLHIKNEGQYDNTVTTLKNVFTNRVMVCRGCDLCLCT
ncbi:MAG: putative sporulation protein YtxC [Carboxydocellales bacterium]